MAYALHRHDRGQLDEAITLLRQAVALQQDLADAHANLCWLLERQGRLEESITEGRAAIRLAPDVSWYHNNLGWSLQLLGRPEEAAEEFRLALRHDPAHEEARVNLRNLEPKLALLPRLGAVRRGEALPADADECIKLAELCQLKRLNRASVELYADAFAADAKLADDIHRWHRYNAACYAALAAVGRGEDAKHLPDKEQQMLRHRALAWLRADLALYAQMAERTEPEKRQFVRQQMAHWQQDSDLASVRDPAALNTLPDDERQQWRQLWDDVASLLRKVEDKK
jgi:tetratricopeptide (TPR) repeat protein